MLKRHRVNENEDRFLYYETIFPFSHSKEILIKTFNDVTNIF